MPVLETHDIAVRFGGNLALNQVGLEVAEGELTGLIGPNGAGKTTLFNVITGLLKPTRGRVVLDGVDVTGTAPHRRARLGLARTFQRLEVFGSLSVRDNVLVAVEAARHREAPEGRSADDLLDLVGVSELRDVRADALSTGNARLVELARALATRPRVLLLDEPASGLDDDETARMAETLAALTDSGLAILLVEHDVPLVMRLCRTVTVLNYGEILAVGSPSEVQADASVIAAYLGHAPETGAAS